MSTTYTWTIDNMFTVDTPEPGFVVNVVWTLTGVDGQYTASIGGNSVFTVQEGTFTPYDQLTQEQVWGWINPSIDRPEIEANLQAMIDEQKNPSVVTPPLPWAQTQGA